MAKKRLQRKPESRHSKKAAPKLEAAVVKEVTLPADGVVKVVLPARTIPIIETSSGVVAVVARPNPYPKKSWWPLLFGRGLK